jgi:eukaryotic-like serine/threonine-protein kinase
VALPARIGRYRILGLLGRGAMGVVYRGRDDGLDRDVAVKVMALVDETAEGHERFLREARSAARLQHPNIVTLYELGEHDGAPFMAMELMEGIDLQHAIASGKRPDPRASLAIVIQVLAGLGHAHEHGIVHRDVKPSNVFLPRRRSAKVMDFGVARVAGGTTAAGVVVGTPNYMSPEQVRTGLVDGRSDLFSVGLILYELVTGEKVYRADNVVSLLYKIAHEEPPLAALPAGPQWEGLRKVVARALVREPEDRYPDARAMAADLGHALVDLGGSAHGVSTADHGVLIPRAPEPTAALPVAARRPVPAAPVESSRRMAWALLAAGTLALLGGLGLFLYLWTPRDGPVAVQSPAPPNPVAPRVSASSGPAAPSRVLGTPMPAITPPTPVPATPPPAQASASAPPPTAASPPPPAGPGADAARLERANDLFDRGRYAAALAEARTVLARNPGNAEARTLVEDAEAAIVVEDRIKKARDALRKGDREKALQEVRAGLVVAPSDARLLALFKEATR